MASRFIQESGLAQSKPNVNTFSTDNSYSGYNSYSEYGQGYNKGFGGSSYKKDYSSYSSGSNSYSSYDDYSKKVNTFESKKVVSSGSGLGNLQGLMNSKLNNQKKNFADYKVGVQVLHTKFGVGTIIKTDGGENNYVSIDFGTLGVKTLSLNFAPLQILK